MFSPRLIGFTLLAVAIVSITVVIALPPQKPGVPPMVTIPDTDGDGIADDQDLVVSGNAGIRLTVHDFAGKDNCRNILPLLDPKCQPSFKLRVDLDQDGTWDHTFSEAYSNSNTVPMAIDETVDVPDAATRIRLHLSITDADGNNPIDYWSSNFSRKGYIELPLTLGDRSLQLDGKGEVAGSVVISVELVVLP